MRTKDSVIAVIERETGRSVDASTKIDELGVDSLEFLNMLQEIENESGVRVNDSEIPANGKVGDIVALVLGHA